LSQFHAASLHHNQYVHAAFIVLLNHALDFSAFKSAAVVVVIDVAAVGCVVHQ
jgi:hypothetical protein